MSLITPDIEAVLNTGDRLVHLVTLARDGRPTATIVWSGVEDGEVVFAHLGEHQKVKNIRNDGRVVLSVVTGGKNAHGLDHYLVVEGTARITEGGAPELLQQLAQRYVGPGVKFPPMDNPPAGFITRVTPTKIGGIGPWAAH
ncbi:MAG: putative F420-dependent enzyme [Ilumatobacteraceae bacterium]|nr:putative F420-dependent enzyme [Ilumatobacteraceae bacterium]MCU1388028.1 putative F420-dependent enzyme [Ilumatobacteraceae bacterium]